MRGWLYQRWSAFIHRLGYHRTRTLYPDGGRPRLYCDWCGLSGPLPTATAELVNAIKQATQEGK